MKIENVAIESITPYERNPRIIPQSAVDKVALSLKEFGWQQPIVVDTERVIIAGHTRLLAAKSLGLTSVPVHIADNLTPEQIAAYRLMDNRSHQETSWNSELLGEELARFSLPELTALSGFEPADFNAGLFRLDLEAPPESVQANLIALEETRAKRKKQRADVVAKNDTERYLVIVFPDRAAREQQLKALGLPTDERYLSSNAVKIELRGPNLAHGSIGVKAGATG